MQTFSNLRRDSSYKEILKLSALLIIIIIYEALSDIHYYLPPLFGIAFVIFLNLIEKRRFLLTIPIFIFLLFFEASKGYLMLSSVMFFLLSYWFVVPKVENFLNCKKCLIPIYVFYAYIGYHLFLIAIHLVLRLDLPEIPLILLYYVAIEILFLVMLV